MIALLLLLFLGGLPLWTWVWYTALMHMDKLHAEGLLDPEAQRWAERILWIGYLHDIALNLTWGSVYFRDMPWEWTVTARLNRLIASGTPEQKTKAFHFRAVWLNNFDRRGIHT